MALLTSHAQAEKHYDTGVTDTEIKIGNVMPYSGPASAYSVIGKTLSAYFKMINDQGGVNGRKINFITYDDGYSPPKMVEQTRKLVESDEVFVIFNALGTAGNSAVQKYLNNKKVPQLFVGSGASKWGDPEHFPWTMGWIPNYRTEAQIYAKYILKNYPGKKVGIMYQNDDLGKDYLAGLHDIFGDRWKDIVVAEAPFEVTAPTMDSQVVQVHAANPDIFLNLGTPKFVAQGIKKAGEMGWKPIQIIANVSQSVSGVIRPAGVQNAQGIMTSAYMKDPTDPQWDHDPAMQKWRDFMDKYYPDGDRADGGTVFGYAVAQGLIKTLEQCGDNLTRENVMKQAENLDFEIGVYLPGVRVKTSPTDFYPIDQLQMMRFEGEKWNLFGPMINGGKTE
jgi:ABC-type branched-subunit amino acid transport system substrate-binding protein